MEIVNLLATCVASARQHAPVGSAHPQTGSFAPAWLYHLYIKYISQTFQISQILHKQDFTRKFYPISA